MRLLLDENVDARLLVYLNSQGHDVTSVQHDYQRSLPDPNILLTAVRERRVLVTHDRDFGDIVFHQNQGHAGLIYLRLRDQSPTNLLMRVEAAMTLGPDENHLFLVVSDHRIRPARMPLR